jgi:eukaryotic-like serine/threonine-protein kinase
MKNLTKNLIALFTVSLFIVMACKKDEPAPIPLSPEKTMSAFSFSSLTPAVTGAISGTSITATVPFGTNLNLAPTITVSAKATVSPSSGSSQDFSKSVAYTVTAEDGSKLTYNVAVSLGKSPEKDILTFAFNGITPAVACTIDAATKTISATLPAGTDATKLVPTLTLSPKATVSPATGVAQDFSKVVTYTVTAEDATTQAYTTKITVEKPVDNGTLYIGSYSGFFYALDPLTGAKKWSVEMPKGADGTPTVVDGLVYVGCLDGKMYALDATNGTKKWEFFHGKANDNSTPMVANGLIYVGGDTKIFCLDAKTGVKKWEFEGDGIYSWQASPTIVNGVVYASIRGGGSKTGMYALDAITGAKKWGPSGDYFLTQSSPAVVNGIVYAGYEYYGSGAGLGGFVAIDASTGIMKWRFKAEGDDKFVDSSPTVSNGIVYMGSWDKKLYALDAATGAKKWAFLTGGWVNDSPIVSNGIVYFASYDYKLYAVDAATGVKKWEAMTDIATLESSPVVFNGLVYITANKKVFAFDAITGAKKWESAPGGDVGTPSVCIVDKDGKVYQSGLNGAIQ